MIDAFFKDNHALVYNVSHLAIEVGQKLTLQVPGAFTLFSSHDQVLEIIEKKRTIEIEALESGTSELKIIYSTGPLGMSKKTKSIFFDVKEAEIVSLILVAEKPVAQ